MENDALDKLISKGLIDVDSAEISTVLDLKDVKAPSHLVSDTTYRWDSPTSGSISTSSTTSATGVTWGALYTPMTLDEIEVTCKKYELYIKESVRLLERYTDEFVAGNITEKDYLKNIEAVVLKRSTYKLACAMLQEIKKED